MQAGEESLRDAFIDSPILVGAEKDGNGRKLFATAVPDTDLNLSASLSLYEAGNYTITAVQGIRGRVSATVYSSRGLGGRVGGVFTVNDLNPASIPSPFTRDYSVSYQVGMLGLPTQSQFLSH